MKTSKNGIKLIHKWEQFRNHPYLPVKGDRPTIGWGNTFYGDGSPVTMSDPPIRRGEANELFQTILEKFEAKVKEYVTVELNKNQFDALVSFTYNVGSEAFRKSTLLKVINNDPNDFKEIKKQFLRWNKSGGQVYKGLMKRRNSEFFLYASPSTK